MLNKRKNIMLPKKNIEQRKPTEDIFITILVMLYVYETLTVAKKAIRLEAFGIMLIILYLYKFINTLYIRC